MLAPITLKYRSACHTCNHVLTKGEAAFWDPNAKPGKRLTCMACCDPRTRHPQSALANRQSAIANPQSATVNSPCPMVPVPPLRRVYLKFNQSCFLCGRTLPATSWQAYNHTLGHACDIAMLNPTTEG